jgi:hypothetical protein
VIGEANPLDLPLQWDFVFVGGVPSPGKAEVSGAGRPYKWDEKDGPGTQGANLTYRGSRNSHFKITLTFWRAEHFAEWDQWQRLLEYDSTKKKVTAVDCYHPSLADRGIKSIVTENIGAVEKVGPTLWQVVISVSEYSPPKTSPTTTPSSSSANQTHFTESGAGSPATNAQDAQQQEIAKLLAIAQQPD